MRTETDWTVQAGTAGGRGRSDIESKHLLGGLLYQIGDRDRDTGAEYLRYRRGRARM